VIARRKLLIAFRRLGLRRRSPLLHSATANAADRFFLFRLQQDGRYHRMINHKVTSALGIKIPQTLQVSASRVIE
jgi:hypothetical protein